jgi:hypothetical protein
MAKSRRLEKQQGSGPYLDAAVICEQIILDKDGTYSAIRLVNRLTIHDTSPERGTIVALPLMLLIGFKAGGFIGERMFSLYLVTPSGQRQEFLKDCPLKFQGGDTGVVAPIQMHLSYEGDGTYWIDVISGHKRHSRVPLTIKYDKRASQ